VQRAALALVFVQAGGSDDYRARESAVNQPPGHEPQAGAEVAGLEGPRGRKSAEERQRALAQQIRSMVTQGGRVESQSDFDAVIANGKEVNHVLHAILTVFTCLIWGIVWIVIAITGGVSRQLVAIDEYGDVLVQNV
jgi:hypothetical protein